MHTPSSVRRHASFLSGAAILLLCSSASWAVDSYDPGTRQLRMPSVAIGAATFTDMVVQVGGIVSGPSGSGPKGSEDRYDPIAQQLTVQAVTVGSATYYNVVVTLTGLASVGGVTGADSYAGGELDIASVQVQGGAVYNNVVIDVAGIVSPGGGMPRATLDQYTPGNDELTIAAVAANGTVYTNAIVRVGKLLGIGSVDVPNVVGNTQAAATAALSSAHLTLGTVATATARRCLPAA